MLEGLDDELADEIDRLKLEIKTKTAEREKAKAQTEVATSVVARNKRLNERKPGMVVRRGRGQGRGKSKVAERRVQVIEVEIAEVELRVQQLERRRDRIKQIIKLAERGRSQTRTSESAQTPADRRQR